MLCRLALAPHEVDPVDFTLVRLTSGGLTLLVIHAIALGSLTGGSAEYRAATARPRGHALAAGALLFLYALPFSFAYISIGASTGALILFTVVQVTMLVGALRAGERFHPLEGVGLIVALGGLTYLVSPGLSAPSPVGSALMGIAGVSWGLYSLWGRASKDPLRDTTNNFVLAVPLAVVARICAQGMGPRLGLPHVVPTGRGMLLAVASGALASGLGYVAWFAALRGLSRIRAATVQLTVPIIAAVGGVALLGESITIRLVLSAVLILGGVGLALAGRARKF